MGNVKRILEAILVSAILLGIFPTTALANGKTGPSPRGEITALGVTVGGAYVAASETAPSIQPRSLLPLTEKQFTLDLTGYFSEELKAVQLQAVVQGLTPLGDDPAETELSKYTVWAKRIYNDETGALLYGDGGYTKIGPEQTLDLSGLYGDCIFDLIVGTSNQLDPNNVRCVVNLRTSRGLENLLDFNAVDSTNQTAVQIYNRSKEYQLSDQRYLLLTDLSSWPEGESRLSFGFSDEWQKRRQDLTAVVYDGFYEKESDLPVDLASKNITAKVWRSGTSTPKGLSSHYADDQSPQKFTLVLKKNGEIFQILPFSVKMVPANVTVDSHIALWKKIEESEFSSYLPVALSNSQTLENGISYTTCEVIDNENLDDTLYLQILSSSPSDESESGDRKSVV